MISIFCTKCLLHKSSACFYNYGSIVRSPCKECQREAALERYHRTHKQARRKKRLTVDEPDIPEIKAAAISRPRGGPGALALLEEW